MSKLERAEDKVQEDDLGTDHGTWDPATGELKGDFPKPPVEHRDVPSVFDKMRLALRTRAGKAAAGITLTGLVAGGGFTAYKMISGDSEKAPSKSDKETSGVEKPGETGQVEQPLQNLPSPTIETIAVDQDPAVVQHYFDTAISPIISTRAGAENTADIDGSDLAGITGGEDVPSLTSFVDKVTSDLQYARADQKKNGKYGFVPNVAVSSEIVSSTEAAGGGLEVEANLRYFAVDDEGQPNGYIVGNQDLYVFTFAPRILELSDGTSKDVMVITGVENITGTE